MPSNRKGIMTASVFHAMPSLSLTQSKLEEKLAYTEGTGMLLIGGG